MDKLPKRKPNRLQGYDYSINEYYFITICTQNRTHLFGKIVGDGLSVPNPQSSIILSPKGKIIESMISQISIKYEGIVIDKYSIMPNHIHMILVLTNHDTNNKNGTGNPSPTISVGHVIGWFKYETTKYINQSNQQGIVKIWQRSFHDHIIRNENEYQLIWNYIDTNPLTWQDDCFYINKAIH